MTEEITLESLAGVGPVTTRKLNDAGIHNIMDLVVRGPVEISELTSMDIETAGKLVEKARDCLLYTSPSPRDVAESRMPSYA